MKERPVTARMNASMITRDKIFVSYSHKDKKLFDEFKTMMAPAIQRGLVDLWDDTRIAIGSRWRDEIQKALMSARVAVLLVSQNFLASHFIAANELPPLLNAAKEEGLVIFWVYLSSCLFEQSEIESYQAAHDITRPLDQLSKSKRQAVLSEICYKLIQTAQQADVAVPRRGSASVPGVIVDAPSTDHFPAGSFQPCAGRDTRGILHEPPSDWISPLRRNNWRYKVVAFDFDGTLLRGEKFDFSWEQVWTKLGIHETIYKPLMHEYELRSASDHFRGGRIAAYQAWCEKACDHFKGRGLTRNMLKEYAQDLRLTLNCREALSELRAHGLVIAIISGGINSYIEDTLPAFRECVDFVFVNELVFSESGALMGVRPTSYDFEGKAEALELVCKRAGCNLDETVFVGDQFNDKSIMLKAQRNIAYTPKDNLNWSANIHISEDNLMKVLPEILIA